MEYMKAVAVMSENDVRLVDDVPKPKIGDYEVLVKVHTCGFCNGTDMQIITGAGGNHGNSLSSYPTILGHEGAGEVIAVGKKVRHIKVGERWVHPNLYPDVGNGYTKTHGGMAQYGMVSDNLAMLEDGYTEADFPWVRQHRFPNTISYEDAGVLLSLAESHSAAKNFGVTEGTEVLIYGSGPMGIALSLFCRLQGGRVTQVDKIQERLELSQRIAGTEHIINSAKIDVATALNGKKFDIAIDIVGFTDILYEASQHLKPGGKVGSMGVLRNQDLLVDTTRLQSNTCLHMLNFPYGEYDIMDETISLIEEGKVNPKDFYSHVLPYEKIHEAIQLTASKQAFKVVLTID